MGKYKIIITDHVADEIDTEKDVLERNLGSDLIIREFQTKNVDEVINEVLDCDAIINCYAKISGELIRKMSNCKIIARYGIGVDTIDVEAATKENIIVTNVPDYCCDEVSDHTITLILNLIRKIKLLDKNVKEWNLNIAKPIKRISNLTLGIIGFGKIGRLVSMKASVFNFKILVYDKIDINNNIYKKCNAEKSSFKNLLKISDVISVHLPLTKETRNLITSEEIALLRKKPIIINTSRAGIINEKDLYNAIIDKKVSGVGLDVLERIPPLNNPLLRFDNVIITPHSAFYSEGAIEEMEIRASMEVVKALKGIKPENVINKEVL